MSSRQRRYQRERAAQGKCGVCGQAAAEGITGYCQRHYEARQTRRRRRREEDREIKQEQSCSYCGESGHNRRTCPERKAEEAEAEVA